MGSREEEILELLRKHSAYELAQLYLSNVKFDAERFGELFLEVLDLGTLATKLFLVLYTRRGKWSTMELARAVKDYRPNVYVALCRLEKQGYVERVSRNTWRLSDRV